MAPIFQQLHDISLLCFKAYQRGYLSTALYYSDRALEVLRYTTLIILDIRTNIFRKQGRIQEALANATGMMTHFSTDIRGYVHAAEILMKQEKVAEAIHTCNTALSCCNVNSESEHKARRLLIEIEQTATHKQNHRTDLLKWLPHEITTIILNQLGFFDILTCLHVSTAWRENIKACCRTTSLHHLKISPIHHQHNSMIPLIYNLLRFPDSVYRTMQLVSKCILNLEFSGWSAIDEESVVQKIVPGIIQIPLDRLCSLTIDIPIGQENIMKLLTKVSGTLEKLYLGNSILPNLRHVFDICSNRIQMITYNNNVDDAPLFVPPLHHEHLLENLTHLRIRSNPIKIADIQYILKRAPFLQEIVLGNCQPNQARNILNIMGLHGPCLHHIKLSPDITLTPTTMLLNNSVDVGESILVDPTAHCRFDATLNVSDHDGVTADMLVPVLDRIGVTITNEEQEHENIVSTPTIIPSFSSALSITAVDYEDFQTHQEYLEHWRILGSFGSIHLRCLQFTLTRDTETLFASMIEKCFALEEVHIIQRFYAPSRVLFDALRGLSALKSFDMSGNISNNQHFNDEMIPDALINNQSAIISFFLHRGARLTKSSLEHISLRYIVAGINVPILFALVHFLSKLKSLHLAGQELSRRTTATRGIEDNHDFPHFQQLHQHHDENDNKMDGSKFINCLTSDGPSCTTQPTLSSSLEYIILEDIHDMTDENIQHLDFKKIKLVCLYQVTTAGIINLCTKSNKLRSLTIVDCPLVDTGYPSLQDLMAFKNIQLC